jgi:NADH-quinone oxidoreductase subunit G
MTELVSVSINGRETQAEKGRLLIDVAEEMNIFVPRFCYHPGMKPVAVCRMCLVEIEGMPKLAPACTTPVADGMKVNTVSEPAVDAQEGMLEFLLINHPLDCPICDRGGECPLQDQTYRHGPGSSRYIEPKRTYEKALEISDLVVLDRERCVLCWRCVRFSDEIAGDQFIQLVDRGAGTQILTFADEPFDSYFSGNTIQICPVGALTATTYRFVSRPWDLKTAPSVCHYCSVGCPITNEARSDKVVRSQALPNEHVNDFWICDKGRFAFHYVESDERLETPLVRKGDNFEPAAWGAALRTAADELQGKERIGVLAGGHLTTEDAHAVARLAKKVLKTPHVDSRMQDAGARYELAMQVTGVAGSNATLNDVETARTIVWAGADPKETLPVLYLRLRKAVLDGGAKLIVVSPRRLSLDTFATHVVRCEAGGTAKALDELATATAESASDFGEPLVVCWEHSSPGRDESPILQAAVDVARARGGKLLVCPPHAGSQGLIDMGVYPTLDAGHKPAETAGMDTRAILEAAASGDLDALLLVGADPIGDFPDQALARRALEKVPFTLAVELFPTASAVLADVVLPSTASPERGGTFTNLERRIQKLEPLVPPPGSAREPWRAIAELAAALGEDFGWATIDDVWNDIRKEVPTHADIHLETLSQAVPPTALQYESGFEADFVAPAVVAGPGAGYPKGYRSGAPFQTGQNWPLSWELRAFEARQRPGMIPAIANGAAVETVTQGVHPQIAPDGFLLYTGRLIYDTGTMAAKTSLLRGLAKRPFVEMNDADVKELGVADGDEVLIKANGTAARCKVVVADIAQGAVFIPYAQEGLAVGALITGLNPTIEVAAP